MAGPKTKVTWVIYSLGSGAVHALYFREPKTVPSGCGMVKTLLTDLEIQNPQRLRVVGERVVRVPALTR